jgi:hypothetical protein
VRNIASRSAWSVPSASSANSSCWVSGNCRHAQDDAQMSSVPQLQRPSEAGLATCVYNRCKNRRPVGCHGSERPLSKHAHIGPGKSGMTHFHPLQPFAVRRDHRSPFDPGQWLKPTHSGHLARRG